MPNTTARLMPKSSANTAICEVTISPEVDIIAIMTNISQNSGWRSIPGSKRSAALRHRLTDGLGDSGRRQLQPLTGEEADEGEKGSRKSSSYVQGR